MTEQARDPLTRREVVTPDDHLGRLAEIADCAAFREELGADGQGHESSVAAAEGLQLSGGPGRDRALDRDDGFGTGMADRLGQGGSHLGEIRSPIPELRRPDREHDHRCSFHRDRRVVVEHERSRGEHPGEQIVEQRLMDGSGALAEQRQTGRVDVEEPHVDARIGEADGGDETDVAGAHHAQRVRALSHRRPGCRALVCHRANNTGRATRLCRFGGGGELWRRAAARLDPA